MKRLEKKGGKCMNKSNLWFISFIIIIMVSLQLLSPIEANAANKNVTKTLKDKSQVIKLIDSMTTWLDFAVLEDARGGKTKTYTLTDRQRLTIAGYLLQGKKLTQSRLQSKCYSLFGSKPSIQKLPLRNSFVYPMPLITRNSYGIAQYNGGNWGDYKPEVKVKKIVKTKSGCYTVSITNYLSTYSNNVKKVIGSSTIKIKKSPKLKYGYKVTWIRVKSNGVGYF